MTPIEVKLTDNGLEYFGLRGKIDGGPFVVVQSSEGPVRGESALWVNDYLLDREQVEALTHRLQAWIDSGSFMVSQ